METLNLYLPYLPGALLLVGIALVLLANAGVRKSAALAVGAVYRAALAVAATYGDDAILWLRSPEGVAYRKALAARAYEVLPATIGPLPVGLVKLWLSQTAWCQIVDAAFSAVVELADDLQQPVAQ